MCDLTAYTKLDAILDTKKTYELATRKSIRKQKFFAIFNYCLSALKDEYQYILKRSYFEKDYEFWWVDYFSKSSYYRKRYYAVISFVRLFEMIYENFNNHSAYLGATC